MCLLKLRNQEPNKEEEIMLTEIVITGEASPLITEKITEKVAGYIGQYFQKDGIQVKKVEGTRFITLPPESMVWSAVGTLTLSIGGRELKVII